MKTSNINGSWETEQRCPLEKLHLNVSQAYASRTGI